MKLSKTAQWILTVGILVAVLASVGVVYARQKARHDDINVELTEAQKELVENSLEKEELESKLSQAGLVLSALEAEFPATQSVEIAKGLLWAANEAGVTITSLSCSAPKGETQGGVTYQVFFLNLFAAGEVEALLTFSNALGYWFPSASIESGNIAIPEEGGEASLRLDLKIYTR